jgi:hypothetical protein
MASAWNNQFLLLLLLWLRKTINVLMFTFRQSLIESQAGFTYMFPILFPLVTDRQMCQTSPQKPQ